MLFWLYNRPWITCRGPSFDKHQSFTSATINSWFYPTIKREFKKWESYLQLDATGVYAQVDSYHQPIQTRNHGYRGLVFDAWPALLGRGIEHNRAQHHPLPRLLWRYILFCNTYYFALDIDKTNKANKS